VNTRVGRRAFLATFAGTAALLFGPRAARAQQPGRLPTIGFLNSASANDWSPRVAAFRQGLNNAGYTEGQNVALIYRFAEYHYDRLHEMALDLARRGVDLIFASGGDNAVQAAMAATNALPIVFTSANDPVSAGYVQSLNRPGGTVTGITFIASSLEAKRIELLHEIDPKAVSIAVLVGSGNARADSEAHQIEAAANTLGLRVRFLKASSEDELGPAFKDIVQSRSDALHIVSNPFFSAKAGTLAALAAAASLPATCDTRDFAAGGGLLSYGGSITEAYRLAGTYVGRILKGEKPAELPVQESTKIELVINLKAAKALGLTVPLTLLGRADEVIE
jgi:putative tryptophan/tyrosine transport system substrate-binding protein